MKWHRTDAIGKYISHDNQWIIEHRGHDRPWVVVPLTEYACDAMRRTWAQVFHSRRFFTLRGAKAAVEKALELTKET